MRRPDAMVRSLRLFLKEESEYTSAWVVSIECPLEDPVGCCFSLDFVFAECRCSTSALVKS